jgi:hypothetical protein
VDMERLPFNPLEYTEHEFEWENETPDVGEQ